MMVAIKETDSDRIYTHLGAAADRRILSLLRSRNVGLKAELLKHAVMQSYDCAKFCWVCAKS